MPTSGAVLAVQFPSRLMPWRHVTYRVSFGRRFAALQAVLGIAVLLVMAIPSVFADEE